MSAASIAENVARIIAVHGETMTLRRTGETDITLKGKRIGGGGTEDMDNSAVQQVFRVKIGADELTASAWAVKAPKKGDKLLVDARPRTVRDAFPLKDGDVVALYELEVAG